jgi:tRNA-Thr(GGU) m(6)t(6)A37 methyltransferase TsaA
MSDAYALVPVATVVGGRAEVRDDDWDAEQAVIRLDAARFTADAVAGLAEFSHLEVVYLFDRVDPGAVETGARHPRGNAAWPRVGIFAQRAKDRPNRLGVSRCTLERVDGLDLHVAGLDAVAGTPVLDIKPYMSEFGPRGPVHQPAWSRELMAGYWG